MCGYSVFSGKVKSPERGESHTGDKRVMQIDCSYIIPHKNYKIKRCAMENENLISKAEGSAYSIAMRKKAAEIRESEKLIYSMKEEFPHLARMWERLKGEKGNE